MYDKRREMRVIPKGNSVSREIEAIKENECETRLKYEHDVATYFDPKLMKVLKKIL